MHQAIYILQCNLTPHSNREECRRMSGSVQSSAIDCDCGGLLSLQCIGMYYSTDKFICKTQYYQGWPPLARSDGRYSAIDCNWLWRWWSYTTIYCTTLQLVAPYSHCNELWLWWHNVAIDWTTFTLQFALHCTTLQWSVTVMASSLAFPAGSCTISPSPLTSASMAKLAHC